MPSTRETREQERGWHQLSADEVLAKLDSESGPGLSGESVERRRGEYGPNEIREREGRGPWTILLDQLREPMVILLFGACGISMAVGEHVDAIAILVIVVLNAVLGFVQDYRAEKAMARLREMTVPEVEVRREGASVTVSARELVPGDIVLVKAGDRVAADCRILMNRNLESQEAALTGESEPVAKTEDPLPGDGLELGDRRNMLYMGTDITAGRGEAVVTETGMRTQLGRIADLIQTAGKPKTPLQRRLARLGVRLSLAALVIVGAVFLLGILRGQDTALMLMTALSMAVAAVPEGLPAVATISLALGARRMLRRHALIRKLPAVETLGSVTVICSDKTGTLTANHMQVTSYWDGDEVLDLHEENPGEDALARHPSLPVLLLTEDLCNDAAVEGDASPSKGDPTEIALVVAAGRFGLDKRKLEELLPRVEELPFDSVRKRMTTLHDTARAGELEGKAAEGFAMLSRLGNTGTLALMKGAVESVLDSCGRVFFGGEPDDLDEDRRKEILDAATGMASDGKRVLALAFRWVEEKASASRISPDLENDFVFLGLAGMIDPPRAEAKDAVNRCRSAGIRPVMITGDHPETAGYIARELGIATGRKPVLGSEIRETPEDELPAFARDVSVYARVAPEDKLTIVEALQRDGQIVAMTGDGVNDAPALKRADIGVAMGITGTDVSKEAAEAVLLDDNFSTIVNAVEEGRTIYDNIRKFLRYTLTSNLGEIWVMLAAPFLGMPLPLIPLQILWINLVTDGLPGLAMAVEPSERDIMNRPPRPPEEPVLNREMVFHILLFGTLMGAVSLAAGFLYWSGEKTESYDPRWGTIIFTVLTLSQMGNALAIRSSRDSLFRIGLLSNPALLGAVSLTFLLQLAVIYLPFLQSIFRTVPLSGLDLLICLGASTLVFWAVEVEKTIRRRRSRTGI